MRASMRRLRRLTDLAAAVPLAARLGALAFALAVAGGSSSVQSTVFEHERLRIRNTFKTPEEVVSYYCARDASGFVWSGLLDSERRAFTTWGEAPQQDSFYIAKTYKIQPSQQANHKGDLADVEVKYEVAAIGDANGTRMPAPQPEMVVHFSLKRVEGVWKIAKPDPRTISPIVLEAKFPTVAAQ